MEDFDPREFFRLERQPTIVFRGGVLSESSWKIKVVKQIPGTEQQQLRRTLAMLQYAVDSVVRRISPDSCAQLFVQNSRLFTDTIATRRAKARDLDLQELLDKFEQIIQSSKSSRPGAEESSEDDDSVVRLEDCQWTLVTFKERRVGGLQSRKDVNVNDYVRRSSSFIDCSLPCYRLPKRLHQSCLLTSVAAGEGRIKLKTGTQTMALGWLLGFIRTR
jgi:hypothetical protein